MSEWDKAFLAEWAKILEHFRTQKVLAIHLNISKRALAMYKARRSMPLEHSYRLEQEGISTVALLTKQRRVKREWTAFV